MYAATYYPARYYARRYFPSAGSSSTPVEPPPTTPVTPTAPGTPPGIISFTSSAVGRPIIAPPLQDRDGGYWRPSIDNDGIVTLTDNAQVTEAEKFAAFLDANGVLWPWQMDPCDQAEATTLAVSTTTPHRVSIRLTFETSTDTFLPFRVYSIRPYLKIQHADVPYRYEAGVEARVTRPSVRITHTGGPFKFDTISLRLKTFKNQVKG